MKFIWILVTTLLVSFCSAEKTLENDVFAAEPTFNVRSPAEEAAIIPMESQRSCKKYKEPCDNDCECCDKNDECHCFTFGYWNCKCFGGTASEQWATCHRKNRECKLNNDCGKVPCTTKKCMG